jgi:hypothetical protein
MINTSKIIYNITKEIADKYVINKGNLNQKINNAIAKSMMI